LAIYRRGKHGDHPSKQKKGGLEEPIANLQSQIDNPKWLLPAAFLNLDFN
jgi:hypothetical protein